MKPDADIRWVTQPQSVHSLEVATTQVAGHTWLEVRDHPSMRRLHPNDDVLSDPLKEALEP